MTTRLTTGLSFHDSVNRVWDRYPQFFEAMQTEGFSTTTVQRRVGAT